jgi:putative GTP pyrophosphokinase
MILSEIYEETRKEYSILPKQYKNRKKMYETVLRELKEKIAIIQSSHKRDAKLRIAYVDARLKSLPSLIRKAVRNRIPAEKVFDSIYDIVGIRIVINNLRDLESLIDEIQKLPGLNILSREEHADPAGYRAIHLKASYLLDKGGDTKYEIVFEMQIRSLLQDAWATLSHHDIYKNKGDLSKLAETISRNLSGILGHLDNMANDFRTEMESKVEPPNDLSESAALDRESIAFLYYEMFGTTPEEYEVQYLSRRVEEYGVATVGDARKGLKKEVLNNLRKIHDKRFAGITISNSDQFEFGLLYAVQGRSAYVEYKKRIEEDLAEVEAIARREILSAMPESFEEFVEELRRDNLSGGVWDAIWELGGGGHCLRCGTEILMPEKAAEAVLDYYGERSADVDLVSLFMNPGGVDAPEMESVDFDEVCSYCGWQMSKDD